MFRVQPILTSHICCKSRILTVLLEISITEIVPNSLKKLRQSGKFFLKGLLLKMHLSNGEVAQQKLKLLPL